MHDTAAIAWQAAVRLLGGASRPARQAGADLARRYGEPHRRYHTGAHLAAVLRDSSWLAGELRLAPAARAVVTLAACAHDVVYDARPGTDERASADWARRQLTACGVAPDAIDQVAGLVLATIGHSAEDGDVAAAVLMDADLAILGADPDEYARYVAAVRQEYAAVPDDEWRVGRARVLSALLEHDPLFRTEPARLRWAARARRNIAAELQAINEIPST